MVSQNIAERPLNITSILNNFTSFMKQAHKKWTHKINKKNDQQNYISAEISQG